MRKSGWCVLLAALQLAAASAATVKWEAPAKIAKDADVRTEGRRICARSFGPAAKVNGVAFVPGDHPKLAVAGPDNVEQATFGGDGAPFSDLSEGYRTLMAGGGWNDGAPGTVTLKELTVGHEYLVQLWTNDSRDIGNERTETVKCGDADPGVTLKYNADQKTNGVGQFVVGTFTADAAALVINLNGNQSTQLNAIQLRDKSVAGDAGVGKWDKPTTVAKDTDVNTDGKLVLARCYSSATKVNGVQFSTDDNPHLVVTGIDQLAADAFPGDAAPFTDLSDGYKTLLTGAIWNDGGAGTVTLKDLIVGHEYVVQLWVSDSREFGFERNETVGFADDDTVSTLAYNAAKKLGGVGQYILGTFKAEGTSLSLTLKGNQSTQLNAIQLRDKTAG